MDITIDPRKEFTRDDLMQAYLNGQKSVKKLAYDAGYNAGLKDGIKLQAEQSANSMRKVLGFSPAQ